MRRPVPGILEMRRQGGSCAPLALKLLLPWVAGLAGYGKQDMPQATAMRGRATSCSAEKGSKATPVAPTTAAADLRSYFDPVRPGRDPWRDESRRPEGGAPVASSLLQKKLLVACH